MAKENQTNEEEIEKEQEELDEEVQELESKIAGWKQLLASTDYQTLKYVDGDITEDDYREIREYREHLREEINETEDEEIALLNSRKK